MNWSCNTLYISFDSNSEVTQKSCTFEHINMFKGVSIIKLSSGKILFERRKTYYPEYLEEPS
jgi:hypothetical protein